MIFMRHAQAENNVKKILAGRTEGVPLTDIGRSQAAQAAELFRRFDVSAVYSSPVMRAHETAKIVAGHNSLEVIVDDRLTELEMGDFTGLRYDDVLSDHGDVFLKFYQGDDAVARNAVETFEHVKSRVAGMVQHALHEHPDQNVALVTHMDPIKAMLSIVIDPSPHALFNLVIANASMNIFGYDGSTFSLSAMNLMDPSRFVQDG